MPREDARSKGMRLLGEDRLWVRPVGPDGVSALCRGTGELYTCGWSFEAGWHRSCPSIGRCSHLWAFETVTVRPKDLRRQRVEEAS